MKINFNHTECCLMIIIVMILSCCCSTSINMVREKEYSLRDDINKDIIEVFYNNDTVGKTNMIYLPK